MRKRIERQRRRDTKPELELRRALWRKGLRYRVDRPPLKGMRRRADLVFGPAKVVVYVDGCFWHSCPEHATIPKNNREWRIEKLSANAARDRDSGRQLTEAGWLMIRIWEHEDTDEAAVRVAAAVGARRGHEWARRRAVPSMGMDGPDILAQTLTVPALVGGKDPKPWQYHSRGTRHSITPCWGVLFDLLGE
jgi:DNA mismatch endonuclease (patch repair protein)